MELKQKIEQALKEAMRTKAEERRNALRLLVNAVKNKEKEARRELEDSEIQQLIASQIKQRKDSIEQYRKGGRQDLADREQAEIAIFEEFLPEALSAEELDRLIDATVEEVGAQSPKDMGKVMKALMPKVSGRADGKQVNERVREKLQKL